MRHVWVERLNVHAVLRAAIHAVFSPTTLYHVESTKYGQMTVKMALRVLRDRLRCEVRTIDMAVKDETGHALYRRQEIMLARLPRSVIPDDPTYPWLPEDQRQHGDIWARLIASNCHDRWHQTIAFLVWVENLYRVGTLKAPIGGVKILIPDGLLSLHVAREYVANRSCPITVAVLTNPLLWLLFFPVPLYPLIGAVRLTAMAYLHPPKTKVDAQALRDGSILVQYHGGVLDTHLNRGNLLWQKASGIDDSRVVLLFNRADSPMDRKTKLSVEQTRYNWVDDGRHVYSSKFLRMALPGLVHALRALPRTWSRIEVSRWAQFAYLNLRVMACRELLRAHNVRLCVFSWIFYTDTGIFALAARQEGAIYMRWTKSMHGPFQNLFHRSFADIAFVWGEYDRAFLRSHDFRFRLMLTTGIIGGDGVDGCAQQAVLAARRGMSPDVRFVIGLFDTGYNRKLYNSEAHIIAYYRHMLALVLSRPHWACIIKTKVDVYGALPHTAGVQDVVAELQRQGRCIVLDGGQAPSTLARAIDAAVCCNINMAGQVVAMHGVPVLHLDYSGQYYVNWYDHPSAEKCFFTDPAKIEPALDAIERGDRSWGDASLWSAAIDHFRDGHGCERAGEAIRFYLDAVASNGDVGRSLETLANWYAARYGEDTVCRPDDPAEGVVDRWITASHDKFYSDRPPAFPN